MARYRGYNRVGARHPHRGVAGAHFEELPRIDHAHPRDPGEIKENLIAAGIGTDTTDVAADLTVHPLIDSKAAPRRMIRKPDDSAKAVSASRVAFRNIGQSLVFRQGEARSHG
jgi:hypothetical protein